MPRVSRSLRKAASRMTGARGFFSGKPPQQPPVDPQKPTTRSAPSEDGAAEPVPARPASIADASVKDEWGYFDTPAASEDAEATPTPVPVRKDSECQTDNEGLPHALAVTADPVNCSVWPIEPPPRRRELGCCGGLFRQ